MTRILENVRKISIPTKKEEEKMKKLADSLVKQVRDEAFRYSQVVTVELGGSYAKGTWLKGQMDLDIFVKLKTDTDEKTFEYIGKKIGFNSMKRYKPFVRYSEHPYVEAKAEGTRVNVVPCYDVEKGQWKSAADRSSFHTKFILETFDENKKNEVRLLKKFLKRVGIYGAEIATEGFGGYVAEVLVYHYGTFMGVLEAASNFVQGQTIGNPTKRFDTALVLIDPIDSNRNLGTAISGQSVAKFILAARSFLKKPSIAFFSGKKRDSNTKNLKNTIIIKFNYKRRSPDIIWGQVKRSTTALAGQLELAGFDVLRKNAVTDEESEAAMIFLLGSLVIERFMVKNGPEIYRKSDSEHFIAKNSKNILTWVDDNGKVLSMQERQFHDAKKFLESLLRGDLAKSGVPSGIIPDIKRGFRILYGDQSVSKSIKKALTVLTSTDGLVFSTNK
ncbi:CCA tRNA nucleotidyltransferase, archaeal type [Candidatus Nitrosotalea sp. TS]|uniref:CCA tRNA nucleotidyltransferase n=1 Tax=Candidatus Nitrosotalea sp. TS TaxID=2341020 RepID=UPI00140DA687|nr:CCA tRNA nucleotidyltransferase [Candidatus Nitrosotalea sp. TS]NHI02798.1 CCA tRNA nucleotidyltransferase, archaeal type [Candidatus Nitrosotalea sp. TS]